MNYNEYYSKNKNVFGSIPEKILMDYNSLIAKDNPVLDIGCGQGRNTIYLSKLGFELEAIDTSLTSIQLMEDIKKKENLKFKSLMSNFSTYHSKQKYSAILLFGLMQILDRAEIELLKRKISSWLMKEGLIFLTSFTVNDNSHRIIKAKAKEIGKNSYLKPDGEKRTFFEVGEVKKMFGQYEIVHYWEGLGPEHRHGESPIERHELIEAVFRY